MRNNYFSNRHKSDELADRKLEHRAYGALGGDCESTGLQDVLEAARDQGCGQDEVEPAQAELTRAAMNAFFEEGDVQPRWRNSWDQRDRKTIRPMEAFRLAAEAK